MRVLVAALLSASLFVFPTLGFAQKLKPSPLKAVTIPPSLKGDAGAGQWKAENERCMECHGVDGRGLGHVDGAGKIVKFAKLAGQFPDYMLKQIRDFRSGVRHDDFMQMMAKSVSDADMVDILAYFSSQKSMQGDGTGDNVTGKNLFLNGDPARNILACASCHTVDARVAVSGKIATPILAGQEWRYLQKQLLDWRSGQRKNDAGGVMNNILKPLSDAEIDGLASYISGLQ
jgi:cytochrome c553